MNKVLIVTGASKGIGAAIATRAAQQGYRVGVNYHRDADGARRVVAAIREAGGTALAIQGDVGSEADVREMFATAEGELGALYGVVNNAAITGPLGSFTDSEAVAIERLFRTNVHGLMHCCRFAIGAFRRAGNGGVIVNLSSAAATTGSPFEYVAYAASKAAVDAFTLGLAREVAAEGIRVCALAPGSTLTGIHALAGDPQRPARIAPQLPMRRLALPEEIAEPVLWLLSPAASYITGTTLRCAGGQ
jgi:NAD(P)-dependent dehydrogenase (short-subunit alcohol dehydrogenase family)